MIEEIIRNIVQEELKKHEERIMSFMKPVQINDELPVVLNISEIASTLRIAESTAYELAKRKDFPSFKIGKRVVVYRENFLQWIKEQSGREI